VWPMPGHGCQSSFLIITREPWTPHLLSGRQSSPGEPQRLSVQAKREGQGTIRSENVTTREALACWPRYGRTDAPWGPLDPRTPAQLPASICAVAYGVQKVCFVARTSDPRKFHPMGPGKMLSLRSFKESVLETCVRWMESSRGGEGVPADERAYKSLDVYIGLAWWV
jgi:hypothetical protein